ncbi:MAG: MFS transporter [Candidatus Hydrogenedentes bacterium]|nr:MFS transporter [Candidatus Hydrogenedentota bacterium]
MAQLPLSRKIFYGMGALTMNLPDLIVMQWLLVRYVPSDRPHLIPKAIMGGIYLFARVIEALSASPIGHFSDTCRSRWGRRLPFMRLGLIPFVAVFFLLFTPPVDHMHWLNIAYVLVLVPTYFILYGVIITPYLSLIPEITTDLKERVDLTTVQSVFLMMSTFLFAASGVVLQKFGWHALAGGAAVIIILAFLPVSYFVKERPRPNQHDAPPLGMMENTLLALRNRPFRYMAAAAALYWFGLNTIIVMVPHWVSSVLGRGEDTVTLMMAPFLLMNLVFFFVFNYLAGRIGKYRAMLITFLGSGIVMAMLAFVGRLGIGSDLIQSTVILAAYGAPAAGFMVLPFAVVGDVIDYDEKLTGRRREGIFIAVQGIFQKISIGISVLVFTFVAYLGGEGMQHLQETAGVVFTGSYVRAGATDPEPYVHEPAPPGVIRVDVLPNGLPAPWTLEGPGGYTRQGTGAALVEGLASGPYRLTWGDVQGHARPEPVRSSTPFGLKLMAVLGALSAFAAFLAFLRYPLRERNGKIVVVE